MADTQAKPPTQPQGAPRPPSPSVADETKQTETEAASSVRLEYGHFAAQGIRPTMEDQAIDIASFRVKGRDGDWAMFAVLDGHGGPQVAQFVKMTLPEIILRELQRTEQSVSDALASAYRQCDAEYMKQRPKDENAGSTACLALFHLSSATVWVANVGDSRAVLCRGGRAIALSRDHKAHREDEVQRIRDAGGFIIHQRVMGELAISRAIGDAEFKADNMKLVIAEPEVEAIKLQKNDEFIVIGCDGLYDVMSNNDTAIAVRQLFQNRESPATIAQKIVSKAVDGLHSRDNVTVIVIKLTPS